MRYMLLIYTNETTQPAPGTPDFGAMMEGYGAFTEEVRQKGVMHAGDPLDSAGGAKTVRVRNGRAVVTAGPFAETAEQLGGYYILNCETIDEATAYAAKIPGAAHGSVEVRAIAEMG